MSYPLRQSLRFSQQALKASSSRTLGRSAFSSTWRREFHNSGCLSALKPYLLADIGEGITECQIVSWSVKPGDRVQQFDLICEVQSDKASVEITSRYEGTIKKLHYDESQMAKVGAPLLDIDVENAEEETNVVHDEETAAAEVMQDITETSDLSVNPDAPPEIEAEVPKTASASVSRATSANAELAIPSVRRLLKELNMDISEVTGTGKDGRIMKEDVQRHAATKQTPQTSPTTSFQPPQTSREDTTVSFDPVQHAMYQSMTQSLSIPHFLYTQIVNLTGLTSLRKRIVENKALSTMLSANGEAKPKLSALPFVLKALSEAIKQTPVLNSSIEVQTGSTRPSLIKKGAHNIGIAMDTPKGLLVPVIQNVQDHSVISLGREIQRLGNLAKEGKLAPTDMSGATIVVSNIGSIGGHVVSPIIMSPTVMILGIGRSREVPAFETDGDGIERIVKREEVVLSWSADHRILDGATVARSAQIVASYLENAEALGLSLK